MSRLIASSRPKLRWPAWQWRHEMLYLTYAGLEICWLTPWFLILCRPAWLLPPYAVALWLGLLLLAFCGSARAGDLFQIELGKQRLVALLLLPLAILASWRFFLHPDLSLFDLGWIKVAGNDLLLGRAGAHWLVMAAVLFLWWRGLSLSQRDFAFESISFAFRAGLLLLTLGTLLLSLLAGSQVNVFIFPFFFFGLLTVALTRLEEVGQAKGQAGQAFDSYWLALMAAAVVALLALGAALALLARPQGIEAMRALWAPIGRALLAGFLWLIALVLAPFDPLLQWLADLFAGFWQSLQGQELFQALQGFDLPSNQARSAQFERYMLMALTILRWLCAAGILLALLVAGLFVGRQQRRRQAEQAESREAVEHDLGAALAALLRTGRDRLRGVWGLVDRYGVGGDLLAAISVRNIYANTSRLAGRRGFARKKAQTAYEYLPTLQTAFPGASAEVMAITNAYVAVHYGEAPTTREQLAELRAAYERLKASPNGQ